MKTTKYLLALITTLLLLNLSVAEAVGGELRSPGKATWPFGFGAKPADPTAGSFSYSMTCGVSHKDACKIGAVGPGGGWIFFVDYNDQYPGFTYLEAAPTDISSVEWCNAYTSIPAVSGWSGNAVGAGQANTTAMIGVCSSGAANSADNYFSPSTKSDWFLGSEGEMMLMYTNLRQAGVGGFLTTNVYWTSTERSSYEAYATRFANGDPSDYIKYQFAEVRPVRAF